ncbi:MAG: FeoC-like transcriptional regulator [Sporomusa sp.]
MMLRKLLSLLEEGRAWSLEDLAGTLGTDVPEVKARLEYLERTGMLHQVKMSGGCNSDCKSCSSKCECNDFKMPTMWEKTKQEGL